MGFFMMIEVSDIGILAVHLGLRVFLLLKFSMEKFFGVETELGCLSELGGRDVLFSDFTVMFDF